MVNSKNIDLKAKQQANKLVIIKNFKIFLILLGLSLVFTLLLASKYFLFKSLIDENNIARKDLYAEKTIEVIDTLRTEQRKKELAQKLDPVMRPAEDIFIINDFNSLISSITQIKDSELTYDEKYDKLLKLLDLSDAEKEKFLASFLLDVTKEAFDSAIEKSKQTLRKVLSVGVTEKDIYNDNINRIISQNMEADSTRIQSRVIPLLLEQIIVPNMVLDEVATELARKNAENSVTPIHVVFEKGEKIVSQGERVSKVKQEALIKSGYSIIQINSKGVAGILILFLIGLSAIYSYLKLYETQFINKRHLSLITILTLFLTIVAVIIPPSLSIYLLPIPAFVIMLSIFTNPRTSFFITVIITLLISAALWLSAARISVFIIVALFTTIFTSKINFTKRFQIIRVGFEITAVMMLCILALALLQLSLSDMTTKWFIPDVVFGLVNCIFSGIIALGMLPILENLTGIITPYGLSELGDANQPLLKRLQFEAPGTFSHSMMLSTLAEAAAEAIGANSALARVGSLYHDIGKLKRPLFFIENQNYFEIENPHCKLSPRLSKMVIVSHVKDGLEIADEYKLPDIIKDFIGQHHGTTLASYFYSQAVKQEGMDSVTKEQFRYSGPKPKTKETAIVMIADTVESASRTVKDYSQEELENFINKLIVEKLNDGQLSDCPLSLKDLKIIASTCVNTIRAAHHQRIQYHNNIVQELEDKQRQKVIRDDKILPENLKSDDKKNND